MVVHQTDLKDPDSRSTPTEPETRRNCIRMSTYWVRCDTGLILDISAEGAKLLARKQLKGRVRMRLWDERLGLSLDADVIWSRRIGFRKWEIGLHFTALDADLNATLSAIVSHFHG